VSTGGLTTGGLTTGSPSSLLTSPAPSSVKKTITSCRLLPSTRRPVIPCSSHARAFQRYKLIADRLPDDGLRDQRRQQRERPLSLLCARQLPQRHRRRRRIRPISSSERPFSAWRARATRTIAGRPSRWVMCRVFPRSRRSRLATHSVARLGSRGRGAWPAGAAGGHAGVVNMSEDSGVALLTPSLSLVPT
jgi:hypothetical protein